MNVQPMRCIAGSGGRLPPAPTPFLGDIPHLRERHGEKIAAMDTATGAIMGAIGLYPGRDEGGVFYHLSGLEVAPEARAAGIDAFLFEEAGRYMREHKAARLKFGTSPLLTGNAELYVTRFGTRYRWREGIRTSEGAPWPFVACECDFDDPLARSLDLRDDEVESRSVLAWKEGRPIPRARVAYSGPLSILLPELSSDTLATAAGEPGYLSALFDAFHALHVHGYSFAWFDRLPGSVLSRGSPAYFYVMKRTVIV
jgi:hypothetical protein